MKKGSFFFESDLNKALSRKKSYKFSRPYGIPVRYHDFNDMSSQGHLDFVEFHLSYQDLLLSPSDYIKGSQKMFFAVHAPELFAEDHILDLCSSDETYRKTSINHLKNVINHCDLIGQCFPEQSPPILINAGGWKNGFLNDKDKQERYDILKDSSEVIAESVQIVIQTMPPFPGTLEASFTIYLLILMR